MPLYPIPYTLYPIPYTLYPIPYTLYPIPSTLYPIPYTLYPIPYTLYPIPYTLYPIPYTLYPIPLYPYTPIHYTPIPTLMTNSLIFEKSKPGRKGYSLPKREVEDNIQNLPERFRRKKDANLPEISENEVQRHFVKLSNANYHIDKGMYPLGSCTMKYNPKINEIAARMSGLLDLHPFQ